MMEAARTAERGSSSEQWSPHGGYARVFSGHESFTCRYGWLPKLYEAVANDPKLFVDDERAILTLGLGRNMVKALRFWGQAFGLLRTERDGSYNSRFAERLLDPGVGHDPYLEDAASLWRLHWIVTAHAGLGAWVAAFLDLHDGQISRERLVELVRSRAITPRGQITQGTAAAHVDILLRTYDWARLDNSVGREEATGCPFQDLRLVETSTANGETIITVKRGQKSQLDVGAFAFALHDFWAGTAGASMTLSLRSLLLERRSPGVVFRLDEASLHSCLEQVIDATRLSLRSDGTGGMDLVASDRKDILDLEGIAWLPN